MVLSLSGDKWCSLRTLVLFVVVLAVYSIAIWTPSDVSESPPFAPPTVHLVTGLLVDGGQGWNAETNRSNETGVWLTDASLHGMNKTVYSSDILLTTASVTSSAALHRFVNRTWQESVLQSLSDRADIDIRPIAQHRRSQECPYYLTYIIDHYDHLPEIVLFSHGRPHAHNAHIVQHWSWFIEQVRHDRHRRFFNASIGFLSVNCGFYLRHSIRSRPILDLLGFDRRRSPFVNQTRSLRVGTHCCAQFIVHRDRIRLRSISFWRLALKLVIDLNDCSHFEHLWHVFFGEADEVDEGKTLVHWYERTHPNASQRCLTYLVTD